MPICKRVTMWTNPAHRRLERRYLFPPVGQHRKPKHLTEHPVQVKEQSFTGVVEQNWLPVPYAACMSQKSTGVPVTGKGHGVDCAPRHPASCEKTPSRKVDQACEAQATRLTQRIHTSLIIPSRLPQDNLVLAGDGPLMCLPEWCCKQKHISKFLCSATLVAAHAGEQKKPNLTPLAIQRWCFARKKNS